MASPINSNFKNQINVVSLGESFNAALYTDRRIANSAASPSGAAPYDKINRTVTSPDLPDAAVVFSPASSGSFNPEIGS